MAVPPPHPLVRLGERGDPFVEVCSLLIYLAHEGHQGRRFDLRGPL